LSLTFTLTIAVDLVASQNDFLYTVGTEEWFSMAIRVVGTPRFFFVLEGEGKVDDPEIERKRRRQGCSLGMLRNVK
jgi:hypothetical protein